MEEEAYEEVEEKAPKDEAEIQVVEPLNCPHQLRFLRLESFFFLFFFGGLVSIVWSEFNLV